MVKFETRRDAKILVRNPSPRLFGKKFWDSKKGKTNHAKTRLQDLSKMLPRFRDPAKIFWDPRFSRYHSPPLLLVDKVAFLYLVMKLSTYYILYFGNSALLTYYPYRKKNSSLQTIISSGCMCHLESVEISYHLSSEIIDPLNQLLSMTGNNLFYPYWFLFVHPLGETHSLHQSKRSRSCVWTGGGSKGWKRWQSTLGERNFKGIRWLQRQLCSERFEIGTSAMLVKA